MEKKSEMIIFKSTQKKLEGDLNIKSCGKRNLSWQCQVNDLSIKLNRANAILFKITKYVSPKISRSIYFALFESHLSFCSLVWAQNFRTIQRIAVSQKNAVKIINFQPRSFHTSSQSSILKFQDKISLENILFFSKSLNNLTYQFIIHSLVLYCIPLFSVH